MKNLPEGVRNKAIEIANALLEEKNMDEGMAIATAISRAKDWAANHGKDSETPAGEYRKKDVKQHGGDEQLVPPPNKWTAKNDKGNEEELLETKQRLMKEAKNVAGRSNASVTVQEKYRKVEDREPINPNWRALKQR